MAEPAQGLRDCVALGATEALGTTQEVALWKDKTSGDTRVTDGTAAAFLVPLGDGETGLGPLQEGGPLQPVFA